MPFSFQFRNRDIMTDFVPRMAVVVALKEIVGGISEFGTEIISFITSQLVLYLAPCCRKGDGPGWWVWRSGVEEPLSFGLIWSTWSLCPDSK